VKGTVNTETAMRIGLRRQLADLADQREQTVSRLAYLDDTIAETLARLRVASEAEL
jgi:hypothetical protein